MIIDSFHRNNCLMITNYDFWRVIYLFLLDRIQSKHDTPETKNKYTKQAISEIKNAFLNEAFFRK